MEHRPSAGSETFNYFPFQVIYHFANNTQVIQASGMWECGNLWGFVKKRVVCSWIFVWNKREAKELQAFVVRIARNFRILGWTPWNWERQSIMNWLWNVLEKTLSLRFCQFLGRLLAQCFISFRIRFAAFAFGASSSSILPSAVFVKNLVSRAKTLFENGTVMDMKKAKTWHRTKGMPLSDHVRRQWDWKMFWWLSKTMRQWSSTSGLMRICRSCHWLQPTDMESVPCNGFFSCCCFWIPRVVILLQKLVIKISENLIQRCTKNWAVTRGCSGLRNWPNPS